MAIAANRAKSSLSNYVILGDDVVVKTAKLAESYSTLMDEIGVDLSKHKSHKSRDLFEFAKTWIYRGRHVSGYPVSGIYETLGQYQMLIPVFLDVAPMRGYSLPFTAGNLPEFSYTLSCMASSFSRQRTNVANRIERGTLFALALANTQSD